MLAARVVTALVAVPLHLAIIIWGRPYHFLIYVATLAVVGLLEMFGLLAATGRRPHRLATLAAGAAFLVGVAYAPAVAAAAAVFLVGVALLVPLARRTPAGAMADGGATLLAFAYVPALFAFLVLLRQRPGGVALLLVLFIAIWIMDTAAYFCGRALGKTRLAPAISPGKTVAGAVAGVAAAFIATPLLAVVAFPTTRLGWLGGLAAAAALAVGDIVGDLAESAFKRDAGVKDSGRILPGHGGVLDRFDAVLFSAPLYYGVVALFSRR